MSTHRTTRGGMDAGPAILGGLTVVLLAVTLGAIYGYAPVEEQMGIVQKLFYFHVPSAYAMYVGFGASALGSAMYLFRRKASWDALGVAGAEVGMLFCVIVLTTGPLWARKAWGVYWTWDPRLTTTLLAGMIYLAYLSLRSFGEAGEVEKRFASALALVGVPTMFLIHESVQRWRGVHPTVITGSGGGITTEMRHVLTLSFVTFTFLVAFLLWVRARLERQRQTVSALTLEAARAGLLEDE
jgi:heme exporter protein C